MEELGLKITALAIVVAIISAIVWGASAIMDHRVDGCMAEGGHTRTECRTMISIQMQGGR